MSKGIYEFLEYAGNQLLADSDLITFCSGNFGKSLTAHVGQDDNDLPSAEDCPCVILTAGGRGLTGASHLKVRAARVCIAIKDPIEEKKYTTTTGLVTYPGLARLDEFADLVAKKLDNLTPHSSGYCISEVGEGPEDRIEFPVYKAWLGLTIQLDSDF